MANVKIYHNPRCSKSRQTLALLEEKGVAPEIIRYLDNPPVEAEISAILEMLGQTPREFMRTGESRFKELGLANKDLSDAQLIAAIAANPILFERPVVVVEDQAAIGRPPENVLGILP